MAEYNINIVDGVATVELPVGNYTVSAVTVNGYKLDTLSPTSIIVTPVSAAYDLTVAADGELTIDVTDDGTSSGTPVEGSTFMRCDKDGNTIAGSEQTTNSSGEIEFDDTPYGDRTSKIYIKNTVAPLGYALIMDILEYQPIDKNTTVELQQTATYTQTINLTDENYIGLNIENATVKIETT